MEVVGLLAITGDPATFNEERMKWMNRVVFLVILIGLVSCKKETPNVPVNTSYNNVGLTCATCPSEFHEYDGYIIPGTHCDDFTSNLIPAGNYSSGETIGHTQNGQYPIVLGNPAMCFVNVAEPGIYMVQGTTSFGFDGSSQTVSFEVYGFLNQYDQLGFSVNGSAVQYLDASYPMTVGGIQVDLDMSAPNPGAFEHSYLTFHGAINDIVIHNFESGIVNSCVTPDPIPPTVNTSGPVSFIDFLNYAGISTGMYPSAKTRLGYYGPNSASVIVDFDDFLGYTPTRVSFVHSYLPGQNSRLLNVQLPGTPLIVTVPDSLDDYLMPYGYQVEVYSIPNGVFWQDGFSPPITGAQVDSIVLKGTDLKHVTIGADLNNSELRSICSYLN